MFFTKKDPAPLYFPSLLFPDRQYFPEVPPVTLSHDFGDAMNTLGIQELRPVPSQTEIANYPAALRRPAFRRNHTETYYSMYVLQTGYGITYYKSLLEKPANNRHILWPQDLIQSVSGTASAGYALLFPWEPDAFYAPLTEVMSSFDALDWQNHDVLELGAKICYALSEINRTGYICGELCPEKLYLNENNRVIFDFSDLIYPMENDALDNALCGDIAAADAWPPPFTRSSLYNGTQPAPDAASQNYSLAALLFYLFFGRYPCEGRLLDGYSSDTKQNRLVKFRAYHAAPYFLFEPNAENNPNRLGNFAAEQDLLRRWDAMPSSLRERFQTVLCHDNAVSAEPPAHDVTPADWLRAFDSILDLRKLDIVI